MLNKIFNFHAWKSFKRKGYWAIASKEKTRPWGMKSKPPAAVPGGKGKMSDILELVTIFIHQLGGRKTQDILKEFALAIDKKGGKVKQS